MFTHIVFFKLSESERDSGVKMRDALLTLEEKVPQVRSMEVGLDVVHSARSYDLALITRFESREDMEAYQVHPEHLRVVEFIKRVTTASAAVDFES